MTPPRRPDLVRADRDLLQAVLAIFLALYVATFTGVPELPDGELSYQTTSALGRNGNLALAGTPEAEWARRVYEEHPAPEGALPLRLGPDEESLYTWFGVGQAILPVPLYWAGRGLGALAPGLEQAHRERGVDGQVSSEYLPHLLVGLRNPVLGALTVTLLLATCRRLGIGRRASFLTALAYGASTYAWPQARSCLSDVQATFLLFAAFHLVVRMRAEFDLHRTPRTWMLVSLGVLLSGTVLTRAAALPAAVGVLACAEVVLRVGRRRLAPVRGASGDLRRHGRRAVLAVGFPILFGAMLMLELNRVRFGDPFDTGYAEAVRGGLFGGEPTTGLTGLLLSPGRGLLWMAPFLVLAPIGFLRLWGRGERMVVFCTVLVLAAVLVPAAFLTGWHGAWTYGPRYLLPALPFLFLGCAAAVQSLVDRGARFWLPAGLATLGLVVNLPGVLVDATTVHDLSLKALVLEELADPEARGPLPGEAVADREERRFQEMLWRWEFAAPWAHWRVLRRRLAVGDERYPVDEVFGLPVEAEVTPARERMRGFRHLALVDAHQRLDVPVGGALVAILWLLVVGVARARRGLDPTRL